MTRATPNHKASTSGATAAFKILPSTITNGTEQEGLRKNLITMTILILSLKQLAVKTVRSRIVLELTVK